MTTTNQKSMRVLRWALVLAFLIIEFSVIFYAIWGARVADEKQVVQGYTEWPEEVVAIADTVPVQDGGRLKPLYSFARFRMLALSGKLKLEIEVPEGENFKSVKVGPTQWLLDCLFRPDLAKELPVFLVDNTEILTALGLEVGPPRKRMSFNEILPVYDQLTARGREVEQKMRERGKDAITLQEKQTNELARQILQFMGLTTSLDFAREGMPIDSAEFPPEMVDQDKMTRFSYWLSVLPFLQKVAQEEQQRRGEISERTRKLFSTMEAFILRSQFGVNWIPNYKEDEKEWIPLGLRLRSLIEGKETYWQDAIADLKQLEDLVAAHKEGDFQAELLKWRDSVVERAEQDGLLEKIEGEARYYRAKFFKHALIWFILAFTIGIFTWFAPRSRFAKFVNWATVISFVAGVAYLGWGIYQRSALMGRPPVGNLYDTIPFITLGAVVVLGLAEWMTRRRVLLSLGAALGTLGIFMSFRFEFGDGTDHMDPLNAVLNSNYWLATHVVTVVLGYSGGLVACFLSQIYVHIRLAGLKEDDRKFQRFMTRSVYGVVCFTLLFSLVGTVLGGIWANDSWGRFWGWDPKENGALLIVLWCLIILHSRLAGWATDWGIHFMSIFMGIVVAFSWWHVNLLGVGLHSYGFTEGMDTTLYQFYLVELLAIGVGVVAWFLAKGRKKNAPGSEGGDGGSNNQAIAKT